MREEVGETGGGREREERSEMEGDGSMSNPESDLPSQFTRVMGKGELGILNNAVEFWHE